RALAGSIDDSDADRLPPEHYTRALEMFMTLYAGQNGEHSQVFPGVLPFIEKLADEGVKLGIVTNKLTSFTDQLLERCGLAKWFDVRICGDTLPVMKPDPAPMRLALEQL